MHPHFASAVRGPLKGNHTCFLEGPVGAGGREALVERLRYLLAQGVAGYSILVLLPDRSTCRRFREAVERLDLGPYGAVDVQTYYGLASRLIRLFWPLVAAEAGFASPQNPPVFLNYESAQYAMGHLVEPLLGQGYFEGLSMRPQRILSQLLDDLNKAAVSGFPLSEVAPRLKGAWVGEEVRLRYYDQVQDCIERFRRHCLERGVLDASLCIEVFNRHLVDKEAFWRYFTQRFCHLLVDAVEESVPVAQDLMLRLLPGVDSALLNGDGGGGFRLFLGADASGVARLREACGQQVVLGDGEGAPAHLAAFAGRLGEKLGQDAGAVATGGSTGAVAGLIRTRYRAQMIEEVARQVERLVGEGVAPGDIAVVAPHADGVLRFSLEEAFRAADIPFAVVRRYETLREEAVVRACLALAVLAHPEWELGLSLFDVGEALALALAPLDPLRAALAARHLYQRKSGQLLSREVLEGALNERLGFATLERYEALRAWIQTYRGEEAVPFDHFLRRLFGELLSRPDLEPEAAAVYSKMIASAAAFRQAAPALGLEAGQVGRRYVGMVFGGVVAAQYLTDLDVEEAPESIALVAPVYTYLLSGHRARFQFWLDVGALTWWEPLHQPLTNHYVLTRNWDPEERWTDAVDFSARNRNLHRLVRGLCLRCREGLYLCFSEAEGRGEPQDSPLLMAVQQVLQEEGR